ncbi:metallophosphoesterase [Streptomyces sp. Ag109_O5-10]|uniref:metallophosphoesterase n=1 Tax=Streptomyces sp. Ag109_O5-10 TaxID=1855349 RepID=UPI000899217C|nr:metallophosphoesterase [Streptomyces sp. Ag109_O5-10]SEE69403.1 hypothetical protein SAMN05216533_3284 [Streptomyces sp. Ag109_O5-10]
MIIVFGLLALAVVTALYGYLWRRLVRETTTGWGWPRRLGTALFVVGPATMFAALFAELGHAPFLLQRVLAWPGFLWMVLSLYLLLAVVAGEAIRPLPGRLPTRPEGGAGNCVTSHDGEQLSARTEGPLKQLTRTRQPTRAAPTRRLFVSRVIGGAAATAATATVGYGTYGVLRGPRVKRVTVPLAKLPRAAHGYRIAVVSDIHLGPVLGRGFAQRVVDTVNATQPDLIAVVGDLVDGSVRDLGPAAAPLAQLSARHGSYFVTGNHEYFSGAPQWVEEVRTLGLRPLENARTELAHFDLAGVNDIAGESTGQGPDFDRALAGRDPARACVLLAHQPVQIHEAVRHHVDLQLSGHTHGGQLWPGNLIAAAANPTVAGLDRYGDTQLYVSRGAGAWGPPTRVGAPSDITVIELASLQA